MPLSAPLSVAERPVADLKPYPGNARTHSKAQIAQIARSIQSFGFTNPILIDEEGGIVAGHGRLLAAKSLGLEHAPTIVMTGLSVGERRALRLADNRLALDAGWDADLLKVELQALADISFDLSLTGFSIGEIDVRLEDADSDEEPPIPDNAPSRARPGDLWTLGDHKVLCGDARDRDGLARLMDGELADAAFLDGPYNVKIAGHANLRRRHREFAMASGEMTAEEFTVFLRESLSAAANVSRAGAVHFLCMDWRHIGELTAAADPVYGSLLNLCVWNKSNAGMGSLYRSKHELVFVYRVGGEGHLNAVELGRHGRHRTNVWDYASVNTLGGARRADLALHPTVKPTRMVADALCDVTRRGDIVLDTFLGSGATLIAAERIGRRCRGIEIDPRYVDIILQRWSDLTNREPVLQSRILEDAA